MNNKEIENKKSTFQEVMHKSLVLLFVFGIVISIGSALSLNNNLRYFLGSLVGTIMPTSTNHYAYGENVGWIDFDPTYSGIDHSTVVEDGGLTGYAWSENAGWIHLDYDDVAGATNTTSTNWGVLNNGAGNLSGYAYSENLGWINFAPTYGGTDYGVIIDSVGDFSGYAWSENAGWISFNCSNANSCADNAGYDYKVSTTWVPVADRLGLACTDDTDCGNYSCGTDSICGGLGATCSVDNDCYDVNNYCGNVSNTCVPSLIGGGANVPGIPVLTVNSTTQITAVWSANSNVAGTQYLALNTTKSTNSGWTTNLSWVSSGLACNTSYIFTVKAKDSEGVVTSTSTATAITNACPQGGAPATPSQPAVPLEVLSETPIVVPPLIVTPVTQSEIVDYVGDALKKISLSLSQNSPLFNQPTTQPPSNLQPTQPPLTQVSGEPVENNSNAIIQVLQKLLQALKDLLNMAF